jgi:tellurite resistance protein TerC
VHIGSLLVVLQLIFLEGVLSIDNAAVLGAMVSHLPEDLAIPWPQPLIALAPASKRLLGGQRSAALKVGLLGAYLGRGTMLFLAGLVVRNPWLRLLGAAYLVRLAVSHFGDLAESEDNLAHTTGAASFWSVVLMVELADLAFSLDNVIAAVALSRNMAIVMLGVALGILLMRFAASIFARLVEREPILQDAAYILVLNIGAELLIEEFAGIRVGEETKFAISAGTLILSIAYARVRLLHAFAPLLRGVARGFAFIDRILSWVLSPLGALLNGARRLLSRTTSAFRPPFRSKQLPPN